MGTKIAKFATFTADAVHALACGGSSPRTTEGENTKTSEEDISSTSFFMNVNKNGGTSAFRGSRISLLSLGKDHDPFLPLVPDTCFSFGSIYPECLVL